MSCDGSIPLIQNYSAGCLQSHLVRNAASWNEFGNVYDRFAIKVQTPDSTIVGHLPMELSRVTKFLMDRGAVVVAEVTSRQQRPSPIAQGGGVEIPCNVTVTTFGNFDDNVFAKYKELVRKLYEEPEPKPDATEPEAIEPEEPSTSKIISGEKRKPEKPSSTSTLKPKKGRPMGGIMSFCKKMERFAAPPAPAVVVLSDDDDDEE